MSDEQTRAALLRASKPPTREFFASLIAANHILHHHNVLGADGHVSVRNPQDRETFFISKSLPSALVSSREDIQEYKVSDASPTANDAETGYEELRIHSEIYKKYEQVMSVIYSRSEAVIPFSIGSIPLRPATSTGSMIGPQVPCFDASLHYKSSDPKSMQVAYEHLGQALAAGFSPSNVFSKTTSLIKNFVTSAAPDPTPYPSSSTVLMRGIGFSCVGHDLYEAVYRAISICANARTQTTALLMQGTFNIGLLGERFGAGEKENGPAKQENIRYLSDKEVQDAAAARTQSIERAWQLWCAEVANSNLYTNEMK
ncbi:hypothetical protein K431DRAFT_278117 [Polychaeton citri CBS 116435]|uniref:Class II aldolase/adducin N-terminal domain-containing protein n=1 Tax=Polychaeton citri CBS 116435 TaxID=1314669 RepID=A0A9P4PZE7_9PEZI|nr:hypothetical protein K431DRAFT_278117 [Polychaeton citri CBS 116435]